MKQLLPSRKIFKVSTTRLKNAHWNLQLSMSEAVTRDEIVTLNSSPVLRFINEINGKSEVELQNQIVKIRQEIKNITQNKDNIDFTRKKELYQQLNEIQFCDDYVCIIMDSVSDFKRANKGFYINGLKFRRLVGTTNGVKKSTIVYVSEHSKNGKPIYQELRKRLDNGRNLQQKLVPAKFEAYKSLACSASVPLTVPKGVLIVNDCITHFVDTYYKIDDSQSEYPQLTKETSDIELIDSDGYGLATPQLMKRWSEDVQENYLLSGCCLRNAFCKGMIFPFDFHKFAHTIAFQNIVTDAWGNKHNINDIELILTTSMLKLWDSYNSIEHYLACCQENGYQFSTTKICPNKLDDERTLNYQFIQSYKLSSEQIKELAKPTLNELLNIRNLDISKTILFLRGMCVNDNNADVGEDDFIKALMINHEMINDGYVQSRIKSMIHKKINEAKIGVLRVEGNYQIVSGDPYALCQSIFGLKVTGLLHKGQIYSDYWNTKNKNRVVAYRAPMTCAENIRLFDVVGNDKQKSWYQYMDKVIVLNAWDMSTHALNGCDKDGDILFTTCNEVLLNATKELPAIQCIQRKAKKEIITEDKLVQANINSFGDDIGTTTNHITAMFDTISQFNEDSREYDELSYRIKCGQHYQQVAIDKAKGIIAKPMPKEWYDLKKAEETECSNIVADKRPYFMMYIYPQQMKAYYDYIKNANKSCLINFGITYDELLKVPSKTEEMQYFIQKYNKFIPVSDYNSTMNNLCHYIEKEIENIKYGFKSNTFNYNIMKSDIDYSKKHLAEINKLYKSYVEQMSIFAQKRKQEKMDKTSVYSFMQNMKNEFRNKCLMVCNDRFELCDIVVDICYRRNTSKQFAWDICGKEIIYNLYVRAKGMITYYVADENGDIEFQGKKFKEGKRRTRQYDNCS